MKFWIFNYLGRVNLPKNNEYLGRVYWRLYMEINIIELTTSNRPAKGLKRSHSEVSHLIYPSFHYLTLPIWTFYRTIILQNFIKEQLWIFSTLILFLSSNKRFSGFKSRWQIEWLEEKTINSFPWVISNLWYVWIVLRLMIRK